MPDDKTKKKLDDVITGTKTLTNSLQSAASKKLLVFLVMVVLALRNDLDENTFTWVSVVAVAYIVAQCLIDCVERTIAMRVRNGDD